MKNLMTIVAIVALEGCYAGGPTGSAPLDQEASGRLSIALNDDGYIELTASDGQKLQRVVKVVTEATNPNSKTIDVRMRNIDLVIDGKTCSATGGDMMQPTVFCETKSINGPQAAAETEEEPPTAMPQTAMSGPTATDLAQRITVDPAMHCGLHNGTPKWQALFDMSITGNREFLDQIASVTYDVFSAHAESGGAQGTDPALNFGTNVGFLTPLSGWTTGPAIVTLKSGTLLTLPGTVIEWTNPEPDTKATGAACPKAT